MEKNIYQEINETLGCYNTIRNIEKFGLHKDYCKSIGFYFTEEDFKVERDLFNIKGIDWLEVSCKPHSEDFIRYHLKDLKMRYVISNSYPFSIKFMIDVIDLNLIDDVNCFYDLFKNQHFKEDELDHLINYIFKRIRKIDVGILWSIVWEYQVYSINYIKKHKSIVYWSSVFKNTQINLSEDYINSIIDKCSQADIFVLIMYKTLSSEFIEKNWSKLYTIDLFYEKQTIPIKLLSKYFNEYTCTLKQLNNICQYQDLSEDFIEKYMYLIDFDILKNNKNLSLSKKDLKLIINKARKLKFYYK